MGKLQLLPKRTLQKLELQLQLHIFANLCMIILYTRRIRRSRHEGGSCQRLVVACGRVTLVILETIQVFVTFAACVTPIGLMFLHSSGARVRD